MDEQDPLENVAEKYRQEGYEVVIHPEASDLPVFLQSSPVDIFARKGEKIVALKMNEEDDSPGGAVGVVADLDADEGLVLLEEAESHLHPETIRSAIVMGWAAFEAAVRGALKRSMSSIASATPRQLIEKLRLNKLVTPEEYTKLLECMYLRNALAHGIRPDNPSADLVPFLFNITRRLLQNGSAIGIRDSVSVAVIRGNVNQSEKLKHLVEEATNVLGTLLGPSRGNVFIEWDSAEDSRKHTVLVLQLSDLTGSVTATFDPSELADATQMRSRLNHLWGDLLQIRSHKQIQRLLSSTGK